MTSTPRYHQYNFENEIENNMNYLLEIYSFNKNIIIVCLEQFYMFTLCKLVANKFFFYYYY